MAAGRRTRMTHHEMPPARHRTPWKHGLMVGSSVDRYPERPISNVRVSTQQDPYDRTRLVATLSRPEGRWTASAASRVSPRAAGSGLGLHDLLGRAR